MGQVITRRGGVSSDHRIILADEKLRDEMDVK
jgi:hypothetical protein